MSKPAELTVRQRCVRFALGLAILGSFFALVVGVPHPGGEAGALLDQTQAMDVQTTALFYADLEQYSVIEARLWGEDGYRALAEGEGTKEDEDASSRGEAP